MEINIKPIHRMKKSDGNKRRKSYRPLLSKRCADKMLMDLLDTDEYDVYNSAMGREEFLFYYYFVKPSLHLIDHWACRYSAKFCMPGIVDELLSGGLETEQMKEMLMISVNQWSQNSMSLLSVNRSTLCTLYKACGTMDKRGLFNYLCHSAAFKDLTFFKLIVKDPRLPRIMTYTVYRDDNETMMSFLRSDDSSRFVITLNKKVVALLEFHKIPRYMG